MKKRLVAALVCVMMVMLLLPATALAEDPPDYTLHFRDGVLYQGGAQNAALYPDDGTWEGEPFKLTLKGFSFTTSAAVALYVPNGTEIVLEDDNTVTSVYNGTDLSSSYAVDCSAGRLTFSGSGTLTATAATVSEANGISCGVFSSDRIIVNGGSITGNGAEAANSYGVRANNEITVNGGSITGTGGHATLDSSYGVYTQGSITAGGGSITGTGGEGINSYGVFANKNIIADGGSIAGTGGHATTLSSYGVYSEEDITAESGSITGTGGVATHRSYGVSATAGISEITVDGGSITGVGDQGTNGSIGIDALNLAVNSGRLVGKSFSGGKALFLKPTAFPDPCYWRTGESDGYQTGTPPDDFHAGKTYVDIRSGLITFTAQPAASTSLTAGSITGSLTAAAGTPVGDPAPTLNWFACDADGTITGGSLGTGGTFTIPTALTAGTHYYRCQADCLNVKINSDVATVAVTAPTEYKITRGRNGEWTKDSDAGLGFTADGDFDRFTGVSVDGRTLAENKYTAVSGSTVVTLDADYLDSLSAGRHTLRVSFTDGYAETNFTVRAADVPDTGDSAQPVLWLGIMLLACTALAAGVLIRRRKQNG